MIIKLIITVSIAVIFSIFEYAAVDVTVCKATHTGISVGVAVANAVVIPDAVASVGAGGFCGPTNNFIFGVGIAGTMLGESRQTMEIIFTARIIDGNYFGEFCLRSIGFL